MIELIRRREGGESESWHLSTGKEDYRSFTECWIFEGALYVVTGWWIWIWKGLEDWCFLPHTPPFSLFVPPPYCFQSCHAEEQGAIVPGISSDLPLSLTTSRLARRSFPVLLSAASSLPPILDPHYSVSSNKFHWPRRRFVIHFASTLPPDHVFRLFTH